MPFIAWAVAAYAAGLLAGFSPALAVPGLLATSAAAVALVLLRPRTGVLQLACALLAGAGILVARDSRRADATCMAGGAPPQRSIAGGSPAPCAVFAQAAAPSTALERWRARAGTTIDTLFGADAPLVRALLIADARTLSPEVRDRFAAAGLIHVLAISGLHIAIIMEVVVLTLQTARVSRSRARWGGLAVTGLYVALIGAPPAALRSAVMLGVMSCSRALQRPVSPWAALALGAAVPLLDPTSVTRIGWQLSVAGFAAVTGARIWCKRNLPRGLRGWRRSLCRAVVVSTLATVVTAPLVAWAFGRVSLVGPLSNVAAAPVIAVLQPALFLAMVAAPLHGVAAFLADSSHPLLSALNGLAAAGASVPFGAVDVVPSAPVAICSGLGALALVVAASSRQAARGLAVAGGALAACIWWPVPAVSGEAELHVIDVGQGDAIAIRTPRGRWILVDAGRVWNGGDAGRSVVVPYVRRLGGEVELFVLTHPHADHVGGAATVLRALHPLGYRDAAFAGGSNAYRQSLTVAADLDVPWARVHPGDAVKLDGVTVTFLAPDSVWTARLSDPNLASTVALVQYGAVRFLLTGDAEAPEEAWLVTHVAALLHADVLKVAHHGSNTSSTPAFLEQVHPRVAIVSVGAGNSYGHPSAQVMRSLLERGAAVLRTDQLGTIVVRTDGHTLRVAAAGREWTLPAMRR